MRRRLTSWVGLFLLLFDVLAGGAMPGARTAVGLTNPQLTYAGIPQDICAHHHGVADDQPDHSSGGDHGGKIFCAFCLPLMHAGIDLPPVAATALAVTWHRGSVASPVEHRAVISARLQSSASPRAPPAASSAMAAPDWRKRPAMLWMVMMQSFRAGTSRSKIPDRPSIL